MDRLVTNHPVADCNPSFPSYDLYSELPCLDDVSPRTYVGCAGFFCPVGDIDILRLQNWDRVGRTFCLMLCL